MCGICGWAGTDSLSHGDVRGVISMMDLLAHRGPDGHGILDEPGVCLGHRRLSIVDVAGGGATDRVGKRKIRGGVQRRDLQPF